MPENNFDEEYIIKFLAETVELITKENELQLTDQIKKNKIENEQTLVQLNGNMRKAKNNNNNENIQDKNEVTKTQQNETKPSRQSNVSLSTSRPRLKIPGFLVEQRITLSLWNTETRM